MSIVFAALWIIGSSIAAGLLFLAYSYLYPPDIRAHHNEVAGFLYSVIGVIYAVLMAFVVLVVWEQFSKTEDNVSWEAGEISGVYRDLPALGPDVAPRIEQHLRNYVQAVIRQEWLLMADGRSSPVAERELRKIWNELQTHPPTTSVQELWYSEMLQRLNAVATARQMRLANSESGVPIVMWFVLIVGGIMAITLSFVFDMENRSMHAALVIAMATSVSMVLFLIWALDHPFAGIIRVSPAAFDQLVALLNMPRL